MVEARRRAGGWPIEYSKPEDVRYRPGGDNIILRLVLYRLWKKRCHWCEVVFPFRQIQIDHLIPENLAGKSRLQELIRHHGLPGNFTVQDPMPFR